MQMIAYGYKKLNRYTGVASTVINWPCVRLYIEKGDEFMYKMVIAIMVVFIALVFTACTQEPMQEGPLILAATYYTNEEYFSEDYASYGSSYEYDYESYAHEQLDFTVSFTSVHAPNYANRLPLAFFTYQEFNEYSNSV